MKSITKSLALTGVLALASTSVYAGNMNSCHDSTSCQSSHKMSACYTPQENKAGYFQSSKGTRFCTAKAIKDRDANRYTNVARHDSESLSKEVEPSKDQPTRNPS